MTKFSFAHFSRLGTAALVGSALFLLADRASAQVVFSANFDTGYTPGTTLSDQNGWTTNDEDTGGTYTYGTTTTRTGTIGQSDDVDFINNFSTNPSDNSATLGGNFAPGIVPGHPVVTLAHATPLGSAPTASYNLDFGVTASSGSFATRDSFGYTFFDGTGSSLFSLNFTPSRNGTSLDDIGYTSSGATTATPYSFALNTRFHLAVNVNVAAKTFSAFLSLPGATTTTALVTNAPFTGGTLSGFEATWSIANNTTTATGTNGTTAYTAPGSNFIAFDNIVVSVPEPSTYAMLGLGVFGLAALVRSRRAQRA